MGAMIAGWISGVSGIIGAIGGVYALSKAIRERRRATVLLYEAVGRPAFPSRRTSGGLPAIEVDGNQVSDPYQVSLYLKADGPKDIRPSEFDGDLKLHFGAPLIGIVDQVGLEENSIVGAPGGESVKIAKQLLKRQELLQVSFLVEGRPALEFESRLADIQETVFDHTSSKPGFLSKRGVVAAAIGAPILLAVSGVIGWFASASAHTVESNAAQFAAGVATASQQAQQLLSKNPQDPAAVKAILEQLGQSAGSYSNTYAPSSYPDRYVTGPFYGPHTNGPGPSSRDIYGSVDPYGPGPYGPSPYGPGYTYGGGSVITGPNPSGRAGSSPTPSQPPPPTALPPSPEAPSASP